MKRTMSNEDRIQACEFIRQGNAKGLDQWYDDIDASQSTHEVLACQIIGYAAPTHNLELLDVLKANGMEPVDGHVVELATSDGTAQDLGWLLEKGAKPTSHAFEVASLIADSEKMSLLLDHAPNKKALVNSCSTSPLLHLAENSTQSPNIEKCTSIALEAGASQTSLPKAYEIAKQRGNKGFVDSVNEHKANESRDGLADALRELRGEVASEGLDSVIARRQSERRTRKRVM